MAATSEAELVERLEAYTRDPHRHQIDTLRFILSHNASSHYLSSSSLNGRTDPVSFRSCIPISSYSDYEDLIARMADGDDTPLLSVDPLLCFFYSSGSSGSLRPKMIPYFDSKKGREVSSFANQASATIIKRLYPSAPTSSKILWFFYGGKVVETKAGIQVMAASAFPLRNPTMKARTWAFLSACITPPDIFLGTDTQQQMYCHLLCGMRKSDLIDALRAPYASGLIAPLRMLESKWHQLCNDIEFGYTGDNVTDPAIRAAMEEFLDGPQPAIAKRIRTVCERNEWGGILVKLWPNVRYVSCVITGTMEQYYPALKHYAGEVPILSGDYFSSECVVALSLDKFQPPEKTRFVMVPTAAYFEFLPFSSDSSVASVEDAKDFSGVEVGRMYELIATTYRGLYRYRLGDVLKVVGFHNSSPEVEYVMRAPQSPYAIVTERDMLSAIRIIRSLLKDETGVEIVEFSSFMNLDSTPKHMAILLEVSAGTHSSNDKMNLVSTLKQCSGALDDCLGSIHKMQRLNCTVGPVEVSIVKTGSFASIQEAALERGATASQYKPPTILHNTVLFVSCVSHDTYRYVSYRQEFRYDTHPVSYIVKVSIDTHPYRMIRAYR